MIGPEFWSNSIGPEPGVQSLNSQSEMGGAEPSITPISLYNTYIRHRANMSGNVRAANWIYTWNNPNISVDDHHASFHDVHPVYHVFQREKGESGTEHFQGYIEFPNAISLKAVKACNSQVHWEKRRGNQQQAIAYSTKEESR